MKPIRVLLLHRDQWYRWARIDGQFAYPVPQFEWDHKVVKIKFSLDLSTLTNEYDIVWWDEGKHRGCTIIPEVGKRDVPVVYWSLYPTLNPSTFNSRLKRATNHADLVLLDHDRLDRWQEKLENRPIRRLAYSVNERYYRDRGVERAIDVGFYCVYGFNKERPAMDEWLRDFCQRKGYSYHSTEGKCRKTHYARLLAKTKVVVHLNRTPATRPPRIFDTAASRCALLSNVMPSVSGECWEPWRHYAPFSKPYSMEYKPFGRNDRLKFTDDECQEVIQGLEWLLDGNRWQLVAEHAHQYVLACHTWRQRAIELYGILLDVFPHLRKDRESWMYP